MNVLARLSAVGFMVLGFFDCLDARADFGSASKDFEKGAFASARQELEKLSSGDDPRVFFLLGDMAHEGKGGPVDLSKSYQDYTLAGIYTQDPDERALAFAKRRMVARGLTPQAILSAESLVGETLKTRMGPENLEASVAEIKKSLASCESECDGFAVKVFGLGPEGHDIVPELESLMTRDPKWMPRESYANALAFVGTQGVPALVRILSDKKEMATEGFWNAQQAMNAIGLLGPTAFAARQGLMDAMEQDYSGLGGESTQLGARLSNASPEDMIAGLKLSLAISIVKVTDPQGEIRERLTNYATAEKEPHAKMAAAWAIGMTYKSPDLGLNAIADHMNDKDPRLRGMALGILGDLCRIDLKNPRLKDLLKETRKIANRASDDQRSTAKELISRCK